MLNFRKLKQDLAPATLKEGKSLREKDMVSFAKVAAMRGEIVRLKGKVLSQFDNTYNCEIEVDLTTSTIMDSDCDCPHKYDCQHLAALVFYLEDHFNELVVEYSKEEGSNQKGIDEKEKVKLAKTFEEASVQDAQKKKKKNQKELLEEYINASKVLGQCPFFLGNREDTQDKAEILVVFEEKKEIEIQIALRLANRSKPIFVPNFKEFIESIRSEETLYIGNKRFFFTLDSFQGIGRELLKLIIDLSYIPEQKTNEKIFRVGCIDSESFGIVLAHVFEETMKENKGLEHLPGLYIGNLEEPLKFSPRWAELNFSLNYLTSPAPKLLLKPKLILDSDTEVDIADVSFFESMHPGLIYHNTYFRFHPSLKRKHLRNLNLFHSLTIPEPLFGTFVENALPEISKIARISEKHVIDKFTTLPFAGEVKAECDLSYMNFELEASLTFIYEGIKVPAAASSLTSDNIHAFVTEDGILARNLTEEQEIIQALFQDFIYDPGQGVFIAKNDKKIVEFMTEVIPLNQNRVSFNCPENLLDQFIYDKTTFKLNLKESGNIDRFICELEVDGHLKGVSIDLMWDCLMGKKPFIEMGSKKSNRKKLEDNGRLNKILVLDLDVLEPVVQIFDEIGIKMIDTHQEERPLFNLAALDPKLFEGLPITFSMSSKLQKIQRQMQGSETLKPSAIPKAVKATLRSYQQEGIHWLERLRNMHLGGILADDMGLGKTLQAIAALTQFKAENPKALSLVVCPTSLVYNWQEEVNKFNPQLKVQVIDGTPQERKRLLSSNQKPDLLVTSYSLLQKDIEIYQSMTLGYMILDEAQNIKNRGTRNAKSVKMVPAQHRLILTGTPIENSLEELWSLFDFLMPGLLSTYDRFVEKYLRPSKNTPSPMESLRRKVSPFIMRRMKKDVLEELPPVSEIIYHCQLSDVQRELYRSYADSAREELKRLVKKEGFDKVQIHVLATLTRLKQICCHPAIFAKEKAEVGDSAKYEMLMELLDLSSKGNIRRLFSANTLKCSTS